ncbi:MAG: hypothetical protein Q8R79_03485 [Legionellaceae bacterium]|nr:hypothetical protein [Legionellaceae bacterium]
MTKIAIFPGSDFSTAQWLFRFLNKMPKKYQVTLYFSKTPMKAIHLPPNGAQFSMYERGLLPHIHRILDQYPPLEEAVCFSPQGLAKKYNTQVFMLENINTPCFTEQLKAENFRAAVSIRCMQIFHQPIINTFDGIPFLNLHSGALPGCKGAMPLFWTKFNRESLATLSLHEIVRGIDEGRVVGKTTFAIDQNMSLLELSCKSVPYGVDLVLETLNRELSGQRVFPEPINHTLDKYNSYPSQDDIARFESDGSKLLPEDPLDFVLKAYAAQEQGLLDKLYKAVNEVIDRDYSDVTRRDPRFFSGKTGLIDQALSRNPNFRP